MIDLRVLFYKCNSLFTGVSSCFPTLHVSMQVKGHETELETFFLLGSCLFMDRKGQGQATKLHTLVEETDVKRFWELKKKTNQTGKK